MSAREGHDYGVGIGDVLLFELAIPGMSPMGQPQWCVVTGLVGFGVRVACRSVIRTDGVPVPAGVMAEFEEDGWVLRPAVRVPLADAISARRVGALPPHYLEQVLAFVGEEMP